MMKDQSAMPEAEAPDAAGMPAARGEGSPLGSSFLGAVRADFAQHGSEVIARIRDEKPEAYLKLVASVLPKDLSAATGGVDDLSDEQIIDRIRALDAAIRPLLPARKRAGGLRKRVPPAKVQL
jgi:hypothetical protein